MYFQALLDLPKDPALTGMPTRVFLHLMDKLDFEEARPVKNWAVATTLHAKPQTIGRALKLLVEKGFLGVGKWERGTGRTYTLKQSRKSSTLAPQRQQSAASTA